MIILGVISEIVKVKKNNSNIHLITEEKELGLGFLISTVLIGS